MKPVPELYDARLYDLLEALAEQARTSVRLLARGLAGNGNLPAGLSEAAQTGAGIAGEIRAHLLQAIVTSLPKADFEALAGSIAAVSVAAERFAARLGLAGESLGGASFTPSLDWIEELSELLLDMVRQLRGFESLDRIKELYPRLQAAADHAENQVQEIVNRAYRHPASPLDVLKIKDLAEQLNAILDRCREAGGLMNGISLRLL